MQKLFSILLISFSILFSQSFAFASAEAKPKPNIRPNFALGPKQNVCFKYAIPGNEQISILGTSETPCKVPITLKEDWPRETLMTLHILIESVQADPKNAKPNRLEMLARNVRNVFDAKSDHSGNIEVNYLQFVGCGSDCIYYQQKSTIQAPGKKNSSDVLAIDTVLIDRELGNFY